MRRVLRVLRAERGDDRGVLGGLVGRLDERARRLESAASRARDQSSDQRSTSSVDRGPSRMSRTRARSRGSSVRFGFSSSGMYRSAAVAATTKQIGTSRGDRRARSSRGSRSGPPRGTPAGRPSGSSSPSVDDASLARDLPNGDRARRRRDARGRMRRGRSRSRASCRTASTSPGRPSRSPSTRPSWRRAQVACRDMAPPGPRESGEPVARRRRRPRSDPTSSWSVRTRRRNRNASSRSTRRASQRRKAVVRRPGTSSSRWRRVPSSSWARRRAATGPTRCRRSWAGRGPGVARVVVTLADNRPIVASLSRSGWFAAWWPDATSSTKMTAYDGAGVVTQLERDPVTGGDAARRPGT